MKVKVPMTLAEYHSDIKIKICFTKITRSFVTRFCMFVLQIHVKGPDIRGAFTGPLGLWFYSLFSNYALPVIIIMDPVYTAYLFIWNYSLSF